MIFSRELQTLKNGHAKNRCAVAAEHDPHLAALCNRSGSLAMLAAMRRASSCVSSFAADRRPGSSSQ